MGRLRRFARGVAFALASALFALLLAELVLRAAGVSHPLFFQPDPVTGAGHIPGASGRFTLEGDAEVRINSAGWRDVERTVARPPRTRRIAVLGDSYMEALQVPREESFTAQLEGALASGDPRHAYEVLNFGVSGFSTAQELLTLRRDVFAYAPDAVLLAFTPENDVSDNLRALRRIDYVPYFRLVDDALVLDESFREAPAYVRRNGTLARLLVTLAAYSRLLQWANHLRLRYNAGRPLPEGARPRRSAYQPPTPGSRFDEAWRVTERLLVAVRDECRARGVPFFVVTLSESSQVHPNPKMRADRAAKLGVPDLSYPEERVRALGERQGFPVLRLAPLLAAETLSSGAHYHGFGARIGRGHWNAAGHASAARHTAAWLREHLR